MRSSVVLRPAASWLLTAAALTLIVGSTSAHPFIQQSGSSGPPAPLVVRASRMVNPRTGSTVPNAVIIIEGDRIRAAGQNVAVPAGAHVIDLGDVTLLPGLIDSHTHLLANLDPGVGSEADSAILLLTRMGNVRRALLGAAMARQALEAGFTTVRDLGNSGLNGDVALRDAIKNGWVPGPRIFASTRAISGAGGQFDRIAEEAQSLIKNEYVSISGPDEARRAVRQALFDGADCIKVIVNTGPVVLALDEMKAIVDEAHRVKKKVAAHADGEQATRIAVDAGVDSIEHGYTIADDVLKDMASKGIFLVPTDGPLEFYVDLAVRPHAKSPEEAEAGRKMFAGFVKSSRDRLARAVKLGVPIAAGSDMYYAYPGKTRGEASGGMFSAYAEAGMRPADIIKAATINAAALLGQQESLGGLDSKMLADIIAVTGDPLSDITALQRVVFVMKAGQVFKTLQTPVDGVPGRR